MGIKKQGRELSDHSISTTEGGERNVAELQQASSRVWPGGWAIFSGQVNKKSILV